MRRSKFWDYGHLQVALKENLLVRSDGEWCTPYGAYKRLGNAMRFLRKHETLERKYEFARKITKMIRSINPIFGILREK